MVAALLIPSLDNPQEENPSTNLDENDKDA
jgi:hypothetical protein